MGLISSLSDWNPIASGIGSLIGGVSSMINQKSANKVNLQIARENNEASLAAMRENNAFQRQQAIDMFNMENAYNTPAAQKARMLEAGMNPYAGSSAGAQMVTGAQGDAATPAGSGLPSFTTPTMQPLPDFMGTAFRNFGEIANAMDKLASAKSKGVDTRFAELSMDERLKGLELENAVKDFQTQLQQVDLDWLPKRYRNEQDKILQEINNLAQDAALKVKQGENMDADTFAKKLQAKLHEANINLTQAQIKRIDKLTPLEALLTKAKTFEATASGKEHEAKAETENQSREARIEDLRQSVKDKKFGRAVTYAREIMKANGVGEAPWTAIYNGFVEYSKGHHVTWHGVKDESTKAFLDELLEDLQ